jgi:transposase
MLNLEEWMEVRDLHRQGYSIRQICQITGFSRNTIRKVLRERVPIQKTRKKRASLLDDYKPFLQQRYSETGLSAVRLLDELRQMGFSGSIDIVRRYLRTVDEPRRLLAKATVRFETPPGEQAQVDWAEVGSFLDDTGKRRKVYAFVMLLSYSRTIYVEFTLRMRLKELIACHQNAFAYFGGFPRQILYDNMAQVRLPGGKFNPLMMDFLSHYGIAAKTHRPYRPRTKGKVERAILYLKDNFLKGRIFAGLADLKAQAFNWQEEVANQRIHQTTKRVPHELFQHENLIPLSSITKYHLTDRAERTVSSEGFVHFAGSRYSVPPAVVGQRVVVECGETKIRVRLGEVVIAEHAPASKPGECVANPEHIAEMWKYTLSRQIRNLPPPVSDSILFQTVQQTALSVYEEVSGR